MDVGKRLCELRLKCNYTQNGLAERAGVSQSHLRRVELGEAAYLIILNYFQAPLYISVYL